MPPVVEYKNGRIYVKQQPLLEGRSEDGYLTADAASGVTSFTVKNIDKFAVNQILLVGELGDENSEIVKTHASSAPSGTTITLAAATVRAHPADTKIYVLQYDQIELSHATSTTGSKTTLTTTAGSGIVSIEADDVDMVYYETEFSSGYYFARFKNSIAGTFSGYTDPLPYGGWASNQVGYLIAHALKRNKTNFNDDITREFCYSEINAALTLTQGKLKRWPQYQSFNSIFGHTTRGINSVSWPTDIYDTKTRRSLAALRIGAEQGLSLVDPIAFEARLGTAVLTTVRSQASVGATSLAVTNSYDFEDSGSVDVFISGTKYSIRYTGVTRDDATGATGALTGIPASGTGSITAIIAAGTNVWQNEEEGEPDTATVRNGAIEIYPIPDATWDNKNVYGDYWKVATAVDSDGDTIDVGRFDMILEWLSWKIRSMIKNEGKLDYEDGFYQQFKERLSDAIRTTPVVTKNRMMPKLNKISYGKNGGRTRPPAGGGYVHDPNA